MLLEAQSIPFLLTGAAEFDEDKWSLPQCFVIHAWTPPGYKHVISWIREALQANFIVRVDLDFGADHSFREEALAGIRQAALIICILDDLAPNVVFEYGYAKALRKPCVVMVRVGAVVNVQRFFDEGSCPDDLTNPPLRIRDHFSDILDLLHDEYDWQAPEHPKVLLGEQLRKTSQESGKTLSRRVLEEWVALLRQTLGARADGFKPLFQYICGSQISLDRPLFGTHRKKKFRKLLQEAIERSQQEIESTPTREAGPLPEVVIDALAALPPEQRLTLAQMFLKTYPENRKLRFEECRATGLLASASGHRDGKANEQAVDFYKRFIHDFPGVAMAHYNLANFQRVLGQTAEAEANYLEAIRIDSSFADALNNYGILLATLGRPADAQAQFEKVLAIQPTSVAAISNLGRLLMDQGEHEQAKERYCRAIDIDPQFADAHSNYGALLLKMGCTEKAQKRLETAVKIDPAHAGAHNNLGMLFTQGGNPRKAEGHYKKALRANPDDPDVHSNYGLLLTDLGRYAEAEEHLKTALAHSPEHANAHTNYGVLLQKTKRPKEAEGEYRRAIQIDPCQADARSNYGGLLKNLRRYEESETQLLKAVEINPRHANAWVNLGSLYHLTQRYPKARRAYEHALKQGTLGEDEQLVRRALQHLPGSPDGNDS